MMIRPPGDLYAAIEIVGRLLHGSDFIARFADEIGCEPTESALRAWAATPFDDDALIQIDQWIVQRLTERLDEIDEAIGAFVGRAADLRNAQLRRIELIELANPLPPDFGDDEPAASIEELIAGHPCEEFLRQVFEEKK
ncbi:MAG: hypothetical protein J0H32_08225 [Rhizobiales bacterium]|nr:hypothetical protein [Hyphomicrobiales bacterium]